MTVVSSRGASGAIAGQGTSGAGRRRAACCVDPVRAGVDVEVDDLREVGALEQHLLARHAAS